MRRPVCLDDFLGVMARLTIQRALVRTAPEDLDCDFDSSNRRLLEACRASPPLVPCPVVIPNTAGDTRQEHQQVEALLSGGAGAVCIRPRQDQWLLEEWVAGPLLQALQRCRLPVFCKAKEVSLQQVADLAGRYPQLPILLAETGYRSQRVLLPLLKAFGNVHFCLGGAYSLHRGVEQLVEQAGPERILFGSGFPESEPAAAVVQLMYADISDQQRSAIGSGNLARLLGEVRR
jgi:hypothetical protein